MSMINRYPPPPLDHHHHHDKSYDASMSCFYSSPCPSSSIVFAQMGSLSINPTSSSLETDQTYMHCTKSPDDHKISCWTTYPFMGNSDSTSADDHQQQHNAAATITDQEEGETTNEGSFGQGGERESQSSVVDCGKSKLCARGHWRPAEDSKLKELVALYGPQNWNLIAEKLEGRSGTHMCFH